MSYGALRILLESFRIILSCFKPPSTPEVCTAIRYISYVLINCQFQLFFSPLSTKKILHKISSNHSEIVFLNLQKNLRFWRKSTSESDARSALWWRSQLPQSLKKGLWVSALAINRNCSWNSSEPKNKNGNLLKSWKQFHFYFWSSLLTGKSLGFYFSTNIPIFIVFGTREGWWKSGIFELASNLHFS